MISEKSQKNENTTGEEGYVEKLASFMRRVKDFFGQRYVWLSLAAGCLWMLSVPFVVTLFQGLLGSSIDEFAWIFQTAFFPLTLSLYLLSDVVAPEIWIAIYGFAFAISMLFCFGIAYIIRRVRIRTM